jgi:hypothetical protein
MCIAEERGVMGSIGLDVRRLMRLGKGGQVSAAGAVRERRIVPGVQPGRLVAWLNIGLSSGKGVHEQ